MSRVYWDTMLFIYWLEIIQSTREELTRFALEWNSATTN